MLVWFPFSVLLFVSCMTDFFYRKISNMLLLVIGVYGLLASLFEMGNLVFIDSLLGLMIGLLILIFPYYKSWIGAGDVKLMGVIGIYLGPALTMLTSIYSMLVGGLIALLYLLHHGLLKESLRSLVNFENSHRQMPYAAALSIGAVLAVLTTHTIKT
jgi:prepilin peptidase CpaA